MMKIALLSALPQEYGCFKRGVGSWRVLSKKPFRSFRTSVLDKELVILETGMGKERLQEAFQWVLENHPPQVVVSMGFAGSLCSDFGVGQVLLGNHFLHVTPLPSSTIQGDVCPAIPSELLCFCKHNGISMARVITMNRPESKALLHQRFADVPSILDMESYFVFKVSAKEGIPFVSLRAVSDGIRDEIDFDLDSISDSTGTVRVSKVMLAAIREPRLVRSFCSSWRRSLVAARQLAKVLVKLVNVPESDLKRMVVSNGFRSR